MRISLKEIENICMKILINAGLNSDEASIIVEDYIDAEARGKLSHGLSAFSIVANDAKNRGKFEIEFQNGVLTFINGNGDIGHIVARESLRIASKICDQHGVSIIGIKNIRRFATPGTISRLAAKNGLISLVFEYGGQAFMAPFGSAEPIISTNPIGIGIPFQDEPLLLDMASSVKAYFYIDLAKKLHQTIPSDWGIDETGNPTTDPNNVKCVSPFGTYKGYALAFMLEILTGILLGVDVGLKGVISKRGALCIFLKPDAFNVDRDGFENNIFNLITDIKKSKKAPGISEIFIPGEQGARRRREIFEQGFLEVDEKIISNLNTLLES